MFSTETNINLIGLAVLILIGILTIFLPRKRAFVPLILAVCYITLGQQLIIGGFHFSALRLVILFGWIRLIVRGEFFLLKLGPVDKIIIWWVIANSIIYTIDWQTMEAFTNRLGFAFNVLGIYFLFRFLIHDFSELKSVIKAMAIIIFPLALFFAFERTTGRNLFSVFGGVPEFTVVRDGLLRCQGPFRHPILAGTFGATLMPLFVFLCFKEERSKILFLLGVGSATIITICSSSSGPLMSYFFGIVGLLCWRLRRHMSLILWSTVFLLVSLHLVMKAPVWYLIARLSSLIGGTGWHRAALIDQAIARFNEWWLIGTTNTAEWMPYVLDSTSTDITNQYIGEGVNGGILTLTLFILIIVFSFRYIGLTLKTVEAEKPFADKFLIWSFGAALFAHAVTFISVPYFDQIIVSWYLLLAMISSLNNLNIIDKIKTDSLAV